jgi:preprotein translocase SecF subunit
VTRTVFELMMRRSEGRSLSIGSDELFAKLGIDFLGKRHLGFIVSGVVFVVGLVSIVALNGLKPGIDFAGGSLMELHFEPPVSIGDIRSQLSQVTVNEQVRDLSGSEIKQFGGPQYILIRVSEGGEEVELTDGILETLKAGFPGSIEESDWVRRIEKVGPKIGSELSGAAVRAVLISLVLILLYMAWRFHRVLYGIAAVAALFHDVLITIGLLSLFGVEITLAVVAALLAIVGYSLNDTIVVFDRIRENLHVARRQSFLSVINTSINECLSRTLITSVTTLIAVAILMIWGGEVNRDFTITLAIGIIVGTYSSIFVASPVLFLGQQRMERAGQQQEGKK